jgi:hypothetical protein
VLERDVLAKTSNQQVEEHVCHSKNEVTKSQKRRSDVRGRISHDSNGFCILNSNFVLISLWYVLCYANYEIDVGNHKISSIYH